MKKKTYILMLAKTFMKGHPRQGQPTYFKEKYLAGEKIHTIRAGADWEKVVKEVNAGIAVLSLREWSYKPYASKQVEIDVLFKLGWQIFEIKQPSLPLLFIDNSNYGIYFIESIANNDGLDKYDFYNWFNYPNPFKGGIIHFTDFEY